jgi:AcrR family transcriptional regulator
MAAPGRKGARRAAAAKRKPGEAVTDGRVQRSVRSRERILDALTGLVAEGNLQPTGRQVAARAGLGLRTVYRHFEDMESLYRELNERVTRAVAPTAAPAASGSLAERVAAMVRFRVRVFERAAPFLRSGASLRWRSAFLSETHAATVRDLRENLHRSVPEVLELPEHRREAAELVASFEAWDRLRTEQRLGRDRAQAIVERTLLDLLEDGAG